MILNLLGGIASKMPYMISRTRYFKHFHRFAKFKRPIDEMPDMLHFIVRNGLENRNNKRWILMADKYACRSEVERLLGPGHLIPLLGKWERPEDIDFDALPKSFILKTNNGCGTNIFVFDKANLNRNAVVKQLKKALKFPYPELSGQPHYAHIKPCVIAEEIMEPEPGRKSLTDYKIHCVNGEPQLLIEFKDRDSVNHFDYKMALYSPKWQKLNPGQNVKDVKDDAVSDNKPEQLDELLESARKLSVGEEYVRVDLYIIGGKIYFGEMTYTPDTGCNKNYWPYQKALKGVLDKIVEDRRALSKKM